MSAVVLCTYAYVEGTVFLNDYHIIPKFVK